MKIGKNRARKMLLLVIVAALLSIVLGTAIYAQKGEFGISPSGERLAKIKNSPNYLNGEFQNQISTAKFQEGTTSFSALWEYQFAEKEHLRPNAPIQTKKTELAQLDKEKDIVIWLGHSSFFMQLGGRRILVDPVFSPYASPASFINKAFDGANPYTAEEMPEIDYLLISHDHWDHLDYPTIMALKPKIKNVICGLGVGAYFEEWGFSPQIIQEGDWFSELKVEPELTIHIVPARHFSGRGVTQNKTLWAGFAVITPQKRIFISGDGGYGPHLKMLGEIFKRFDLAIIENGQYNRQWPYIHMMPEEVALAAEELNADALLPAHAGKFALSQHAWDEPFKRISAASENKSYKLLTPLIGESVELDDRQQVFSRWWENVKD